MTPKELELAKKKLRLLELEEEEALAMQSAEPEPAPMAAPAPEKAESVYSKMGADISSAFTSDPKASMPMRALQAGSGLLKGALVDAPMTAVSEGLKTLSRVPGSGLSTLAALGGKAAELVGRSPVGKANEAYQGDVNRFMERHPNVSAIDKTLGNAVQIAPFASPVLSAGGKLAEKAGLAALRGEAKITNTLGQKAASTPMAGKEKIVSDISKYNLQSTKGGFSGIADNAQAEIKVRDRMADDILKAKQKEAPDMRISLDNVMHEYEKKLADDIADIPFDQKDKAIEIKNELIAKLKRELGKDEDLPAALTLLEANRARQILSKGAFKKGAFNQTDPIRDQVKQDLAMSFRDEVAKSVPQQAEYNRQIRDLINVKKAAQEADARIAGHNPIMSMGNAIATGLGTAGGHALGSPTAGALASLAAKNMLQSGRGASALVSAGKGAKKLSELTDLSRLARIGNNPELDAITKSQFYTSPKDARMVTQTSEDVYPAYHGTNVKFDSFDSRFAGSQNGGPGTKKGFFFGEPQAAQEYAEEAVATHKKGTPIVMERNLEIENPRIVDALKLENDGDYADIEYEIKQAEKNGNDGVIFKNIKDAPADGDTEERRTVYFIFDHKKIKAVR